MERPNRRRSRSDRDQPRSKSPTPQTLPGDAVICPAYLLGPLAEAKRLAPVPRSIARDPNGPWSQTFELLRNQEAVWGNEVYGVPLGSPVFCCYYRADLLEKLHRKPPQTWKEYEELARLLREEGAKSGGLKYGTVEPLARGWAGLVLLARAAAYAKERDNYTTLFDEKTLEPAIAGPPFVRALEELVAAAKLGPAEQLDFDPAAARAEFWKGSAAMAISWPTGATNADPGPSPAERRTERGAFRLPVSRNCPAQPRSTGLPATSWEPRSDDAGQRVPLLGVAGRMGVVRAESEHADAAFELAPLADRSAVGQPGLCRQSRDDALPPRASRITQGLGREQRIGNGRAGNTPSKPRKRSRGGSSSRRSACPAGPTTWRPSMKPCRRPCAASKSRPRR